MRVLTVERDEADRERTAALLRAAEIDCEMATPGNAGPAIVVGVPDVVILSDNEQVRALRDAGIKTPFVVLGERAGYQAVYWALTLGADDYLSKPCDERELVARLRAVARRDRTVTPDMVVLGALSIDLTEQKIRVANNQIHLTSLEFKTLALLARRAPSVVTKETLLIDVYQGRDEASPRIFDILICKIRHKLSGPTDENFIETVWGRGWKLSPSTPFVRQAHRPRGYGTILKTMIEART